MPTTYWAARIRRGDRSIPDSTRIMVITVTDACLQTLAATAGCLNCQNWKDGSYQVVRFSVTQGGIYHAVPLIFPATLDPDTQIRRIPTLDVLSDGQKPSRIVNAVFTEPSHFCFQIGLTNVTYYSSLFSLETLAANLNTPSTPQGVSDADSSE